VRVATQQTTADQEFNKATGDVNACKSPPADACEQASRFYVAAQIAGKGAPREAGLLKSYAALCDRCPQSANDCAKRFHDRVAALQTVPREDFKDLGFLMSHAGGDLSVGCGELLNGLAIPIANSTPVSALAEQAVATLLPDCMAKDPDGSLLPLARVVAREIHPKDPRGASGILNHTKPLLFHSLAMVKPDGYTSTERPDGGAMLDGKPDTAIAFPPHPGSWQASTPPSATLAFTPPLRDLKRVDVLFSGDGEVRAQVPIKAPWPTSVSEVHPVVCRLGPPVLADGGLVALPPGLAQSVECSVDPWLVGVSSLQLFSEGDAGVSLREMGIYGEREGAQNEAPKTSGQKVSTPKP
jgi:hypothetical protein